MSRYKETYTNLYHGTTTDAVAEIVSSQYFIASDAGSWCGTGIYFYDNKSKALWAAKRKCEELEKKTGAKYNHTYVTVDIVDLDKKYILDLRSHKDFASFANFASSLLDQVSFDIVDDFDSEEKMIKKRAMIISLYAKMNEKKLIVGNFLQRTNNKLTDIRALADSMHLVVGVETIYCVKDGTVISNIRGRVYD